MRLQHFAVAGVLIILASAAPADNLRRVAEGNERAFIKAIKAKDISWFQKVAAPDFYELDQKGHKSDAKMALEQLKGMFAAFTVTSVNARVIKITPKGRGMIVRAEGHMSAEMKGQGGKKSSKMVDDSVMDEYWSKDNGVWKIHWLKTVSEKSTMDGKPMSGGM